MQRGYRTLLSVTAIQMTNTSMTIVTCTYSPDADRARRLCQSIDRFVPSDIAHCLIVPQRDTALFKDLASPRRFLRTVEEVLPATFTQLPLSSRWWLAPGMWPVRGWIIQQLVKLSANRAVESEIILFADSDVTFIRAFDEELYCHEGLVRLHRIADAAQDQDHIRWHNKAASLLGEEPGYFGSDYIGQLITWRRSNLEQLQIHLEKIHGKPWHQLIARSLHLSEYILYGAFVEHVLGQEKSGHFCSDTDICHCCWFQEDARQLLCGEQRINERAQALLLQSNLGMALESEAALFQMLQSSAPNSSVGQLLL